SSARACAYTVPRASKTALALSSLWSDQSAWHSHELDPIPRLYHSVRPRRWILGGGGTLCAACHDHRRYKCCQFRRRTTLARRGLPGQAPDGSGQLRTRAAFAATARVRVSISGL